MLFANHAIQCADKKPAGPAGRVKNQIVRRDLNKIANEINYMARREILAACIAASVAKKSFVQLSQIIVLLQERANVQLFENVNDFPGAPRKNFVPRIDLQAARKFWLVGALHG